MDKLAGIYKITNKKNSKIYIGESEDIPHRWMEHITDLICGEHCNSKLQTDFNIYGIKNFEFDVLETFRIDEDDKTNSSFKLKMTLLCREYVYINHFNSINNGYNIVNSLNETLMDHIGIFNRNETASENEQRMIRNFMKDNTDILKINWNKMDSIHKVNKNNRRSGTIKNVDTSLCKCMTAEFKYLENKNMFSYIHFGINLEIFKTILVNKGLLMCNPAYEASKLSLDREFMINGNRINTKNGNSYLRPYITKLGEKEIIKIFENKDILQITVNIIKKLRKLKPYEQFYTKFNEYF